MEQLEVEEKARAPARRGKTPTRSRTATRSRTPPARSKTPTRGRGKTAAASKAAVAKPDPEKPTPSVASECAILLRQKGSVQRLIAQSLALQGECATAAEALEQAASLPAGSQEIISQGLAEAMARLQEALSLVESDPVFSVLQESTISFPSIAQSLELAGVTLTPVKKPASRRVASKTKHFIEVLEQARDCIFKVHSKAMKSGSSTTIPRVASLLTSIIVLLSALTSVKGPGPQHPLYASYSLGMQ
jgi:separase